MNLSISKNALYNALNTVSHAVSPNSPQPVLRGIKITADETGLTLIGSDADISIMKKIKADEENKMNIVDTGSLLIESRYLTEIVRKLDSEIIQIEIVDGALTKFSGSSAVFKINGMKPEDYPNIDFRTIGNPISMDKNALVSIIEGTAFAAATKDTRPVLTGVNFKLENNILSCTATDSFRLAKKTMKFDLDDSFNITIPAKTMFEIKNSMLNDTVEKIEIYQNGKKVQFVSDDMIIQSRLLDGEYPETDRLIPKEFPYVLTIDREELIRAIDRTIFIKNENMAINRLQCSSDEIVITNRSQEIGESHENLYGEYTGEPIDISFSANYVISAAKYIGGRTIKICFSGQMKPFVILNTEDDSILQLVLPVRTYN